MCGIAGVLQLGAPGAPGAMQDQVLAMASVLAHRGPDGDGAWVSQDGAVALGHRRLAIIDLSEAALQPMASADAPLRIVFNGEIYNHAEIRAELQRIGGHTWTTDHSDTEVILHAFEEWGIACLDRLRGMFAFGLWDGRTRDLWLVRDRIGIKPLYYSVHHGRVVFASEIKALLLDPDQERAIDEDALGDYLSFLTTPAPSTLFRGIRKLPAGTWLRVRAGGGLEQHRYWDVWDYTTPLRGASDQEVAERVLAELRTSVQLRQVSDVPVGVFLSGGIDSSTNAVLFSESARGRVSTFTVGYRGDHASYRNELDYARLVANRIGAAHHERLLDQDDLLAFLPQMVALQDEPIADPVCVPVYYVSQLAREAGVTVCQLGEGADELFWGYPAWKRMLHLQQLDALPLPGALKRLGLSALRAAGRGHRTYFEWLRRGVAGQPVFWGGAEAFTQVQKERLLGPRLRRAYAGRTSWDALAGHFRRFTEAAWEPSPLHWMTYLDLNVRLPDLLLMRVDKMSMGVGLEARVPFLDHKLVELALSIPSTTKTRGGTLKRVLKLAVAGLVPDEIIQRPKQGFAVPVEDWLLDKLGESVQTELRAFCRETDLLDAAEVERVVAQRRAAYVWPLLNLALWWKHYGVARESVRHSETAPVR